MRTFTSLEIRFEYVLVGKLPNRRIIRRNIRSCDSGINSSGYLFYNIGMYLVSFTLSPSGAVRIPYRYKVFRYNLIGAEPFASIPVPERYRSICPHYKLSGPNCTGTVCSGTSPTKYWVSDRNGISNAFTDVDWWSGTVPVPSPYRPRTVPT